MFGRVVVFLVIFSDCLQWFFCLGFLLLLFVCLFFYYSTVFIVFSIRIIEIPHDYSSGHFTISSYLHKQFRVYFLVSPCRYSSLCLKCFYILLHFSLQTSLLLQFPRAFCHIRLLFYNFINTITSTIYLFFTGRKFLWRILQQLQRQMSKQWSAI